MPELVLQVVEAGACEAESGDVLVAEIIRDTVAELSREGCEDVFSSFVLRSGDAEVGKSVSHDEIVLCLDGAFEDLAESGYVHWIRHQEFAAALVFPPLLLSRTNSRVRWRLPPYSSFDFTSERCDSDVPFMKSGDTLVDLEAVRVKRKRTPRKPADVSRAYVFPSVTARVVWRTFFN